MTSSSLPHMEILTLFFHIHERLCDTHHLDELVAQLDAVLSISVAQKETNTLIVGSSVKSSILESNDFLYILFN